MLNKKLKYLVQANLVIVLGLSTLALIGNTPAQAASLEITDFTSFNDPDSINGGTYAVGINNHGAIIGNTNTQLAFLYQGGHYTTLNPPNATGTYPSGINDRGAIVGIYEDANGYYYGFLDQGGNYTTLNDPSSISTGYTNPSAINDRGDIIGNYIDVNSNIDGFLDQGGNYTTLKYNPNDVFTYLSGINNHGEIVGYDFNGTNFIYQNGNYTALSINGLANAINDKGQIAGYYGDANGNIHGFIYQEGTSTTVNYPGATSTYVYGINDREEIVGYYEDANGNISGFTAEVKAVPEPGTVAATFVFGIGLITARLKLLRKQKASLAA